ncbi:hypothetical protein AMTR_s00003p00240780 [Amborella trichopoda]|uniref:Uncharacterized protein n=1 Tax=Amborella trichopoda TaxID=13333 RepID=W1P0H5_AMBTC|nr:hypothetical protein AMTR_s00003p00240780 [Amborella trichopoda]
MFPLFHRIVAKRTPSSTRPKFDPLLIDPLVVIVLNDADDYMALDGEALHPARDVPPSTAEEVDIGLGVVDPDRALVVVDAPPPLAVFHFDVNPLLFHLIAAPVHLSGFPTADPAPTVMSHEHEAADTELAPMPLAMPYLVSRHGGDSVVRYEHRGKTGGDVGRFRNSSEQNK